MPRQLGPRFALEAAFLILVAVGAGLLDLRPLLIVLVMAVAWLLVALMEYAASREAARYAVRPGRYGPLPVEETPPVAEQVVEDRPSPTLLEHKPPPARPPEDEAVTEVAPAPAPAAADRNAPRESTARPAGGAEEEPSERAGRQTLVAEAEPAGGQTAFVEKRPRMRFRLDPLQPRPKRRWFWQRKPEGEEKAPGEESTDAPEAEHRDEG
jgi:hypothetical protein